MLSEMLDKATAYFASMDPVELTWVVLGFAAQGLFMMRFVVQWIASEKAKRSVMPVAFWYFSVAGGLLLFVYSLYRVDPVFIVGQGSGLIIYSRNLWLIHAERRHLRDRAAAEASHVKAAAPIGSASAVAGE